MIDVTVLNYLNENLDAPVLMELPEVPSEDYPTFPEKLVVIERIATSRTNHVNVVSLAFQSYADSLYEAALLDEQVRSLMDDIVVLDEIGGIRLASNYNFTDTRTKRYRYQCVYDIYFV